MFAPSQESVNVVLEWLESNGIYENITHSENKGWLVFDASASEMEQLLSTEYHEYKHEISGNTAVACDK